MFVNAKFMLHSAPESREIIKGYPVLFEYAGRIHDTYFPDYEKWESF